MRYAFIQNLLPLHRKSRVGYHLACAAAAASEDGDDRMRAIIDLMTDEELEAAREAKKTARKAGRIGV